MADQSTTNQGNKPSIESAPAPEAGQTYHAATPPQSLEGRNPFKEYTSENEDNSFVDSDALDAARTLTTLDRPVFSEGNSGVSEDNSSTEQQGAGQDANAAPQPPVRQAKPIVQTSPDEDTVGAGEGTDETNAGKTSAGLDKSSPSLTQNASAGAKGKRGKKMIKAESPAIEVPDDCAANETYIYVREGILKVKVEGVFQEELGSKLPPQENLSLKTEFKFDGKDKTNFGMPSAKFTRGRAKGKDLKGEDQYYTSKALAVIIGMGYDGNNTNFSKNKMRQLTQFNQYNHLKLSTYIPSGPAAVVKDTKGNYYYLSYAGQIALWGTEGQVERSTVKGVKAIYRDHVHRTNIKPVDSMHKLPGASPLMLIDEPRPNRDGWANNEQKVLLQLPSIAFQPFSGPTSVSGGQSSTAGISSRSSKGKTAAAADDASDDEDGQSTMAGKAKSKKRKASTLLNEGNDNQDSGADAEEKRQAKKAKKAKKAKRQQESFREYVQNLEMEDSDGEQQGKTKVKQEQGGDDAGQVLEDTETVVDGEGQGAVAAEQGGDDADADEDDDDINKYLLT